MTRSMRWVLALGLGSALAASATGAAPARKSAPAGKPPQVASVTLGIRHRVFPNFYEESKVAMRQSFQVGDTPYSARVVEFIPDFSYDIKTRKAVSYSNEPKNPAFRIIVREKGVPRDTVWAFVNMPPHFAMKSMLAFHVKRIDFVDRPPIWTDTTSTSERKP